MQYDWKRSTFKHISYFPLLSLLLCPHCTACPHNTSLSTRIIDPKMQPLIRSRKIDETSTKCACMNTEYSSFLPKLASTVFSFFSSDAANKNKNFIVLLFFCRGGNWSFIVLNFYWFLFVFEATGLIENRIFRRSINKQLDEEIINFSLV